jgi:predicted nucleic acid-binding protein
VPDRLARGLLDTSVIVGLDHLDVAGLPEEVAISTITLAELSAGPSATTDVSERACWQDRLQRTEATFDPLPFDIEAAASVRSRTCRCDRTRSPAAAAVRRSLDCRDRPCRRIAACDAQQ